MKEACLDVATLKNWLDMRLPEKDMIDRCLYRWLIKKGDLRDGLNSRDENESKVVNGENFIRYILPFCSPYYSGKKATVQSVDPHSVLAGTYKLYKDLSYAEAVILANNLDKASREETPSAAHYVKVGPFNLYVASEGKNRVSVYRKLNRQIVARVNQCNFPAAEELVLRRVTPWTNIVALEFTGPMHKLLEELHDHQIVNQSRSNIALLPFVESVKLLEKYGVTWGDDIFSLTAALQLRKLRMLIGHRYYVR